VRIILATESPDTLTRLSTSMAEIRDVLHQVADGQGQPWLVIAVYLTDGVQWAGKIYGAIHTPAMFRQAEDHWTLVQRWPAPNDLPDRYRLIRLRIGQDTPYPYRDTDEYGWQWVFPSFASQLAVLARHEFEHLSRPQHDEHLASRWALDFVQRRLGYPIRAVLPADAVPAPHPVRPRPAVRTWRPRRGYAGVGSHRIVRIPRRRRR
jgi:hypothetical protein